MLTADWFCSVLGPINDDAILHILRLRDKLNWQTLLPPCEFVKSQDVAKFRKIPLLDDALKKDDGEYIYCLIRSRDDPKAAYNPYDLQVVSANMARRSKEYWTISASYVSKFTSVCGKHEMEITPVMEWLYERQLYNVLHNMDLYFNFRRKYYTCDGKPMAHVPVVAHRVLSTGTRAITPVQFCCINTAYTYTLDEFCEEQYQQSQHALSQLQSFKDKVIEVIQACFLKVAKEKGAETLFQPSLYDLKEKPKYFEIAEWRHIMERFSKFLKLVDRIFQEFLRRLVNNAINTLLEIFKGSSNMTISKKKTNESLMRTYKNSIEKALFLLTENRCLWVYENEHFEGTQKLLHRSKETEAQHDIVTVSDIDKILEEVKRQLKGEEEYFPIFEINICLRIPYEKEHRRKYYQNDDDYILESSAESLKEILDFDEVLSSSFEDDSKHEERSESTTEDLGTFRNEGKLRPLRKEAISDSDKQLITYESSLQFSTDVSLIPNRKSFSIQLQGIVDGLENIIDQVTPFSQDSRLSIFIDQSLHKIMQQCEDYTDFEPGHYQSTWPNCDLILGTDPDYQNKILELLSLQSSSLARVESYSRNFMEYCSMVDKAKYTNDKMVALERELTTKEFRNILENYTVDVKEIVCMLIEKRISLFRVNSLNFQTDCLPYFEGLLKTIHFHFYTAIDTKNVHLVEVTQSAVTKLNKELVTVDGFVEHLLYLQEISSQLPNIKVEYHYLSELHFIANDYNIFLPHQQLALYQTVVRTLQNLQSTILICEKMKDDYVIKFNESLGEFMDNLQVEMKEYKSKVRNPVLLLSETLPKTAKEMIENLIEEAGIISEKILNYANYQHVLDGAIGDMKSLSVEKLSHRSQAGDSQRVNAELSEIEGELQLRKLLWDSHEDWAKLIFKWKHTIFWNLDVDVIQSEVNRFMQRIHILEKGLPENTILPIMKKSLLDFKESLPIIISLRNPSLQRRHWETIQNIVGEAISWDKRLTLEKILELNMFQYRKDINEISIRASKETTLEVMFKNIISLWQKTDFHLCPYNTETSSICIISSVEDITTLLEESLMTISTIKSSCFVEPIKNLVHAWDHKLNLISCTLEEWLTCQRHWIYLEPIFQAPEIKRQLPEEASLFSVVDNKWKEIMNFAAETPNVLAATTSGIFEILQSNNASLEKIQKALEEYLEVKRMIFPRFYFLSNAELLEIVAESKNPDVVQPHLMKCFSNVRKLYIRPQHQTPPVILMIRSAEGEILLIPKGVRIRGSVEQWLKNVENTMYNMVRKFIEVGITEWNQMEFKEWFFTHPGQVILIVEMIEDLDDLISVLEQLTEIASDILPYHKQSTLEALISLSIHNRDILSLLIDQEIGIKDFEWTRQLRYKWHECNLCTVIQGYASFEYGYEYLGCSPRLVITPLTDQCWLTITGALQLNLGCCLAGPAGTGKTETVKDLSKALGKFCLTYNCSGNLDDKVMAKLFFGLVQSGSWCCFDEFNRIDIEVLSAIASHLQAIKAAKDSLNVRFVLEGKEIRLRPHCAIFITMNPGYKGRVELPDNLKSLFRPMSMVIPDYELIAEIMLFSEGFKSAKLLSGKIINLYQLSSKRLSLQDHYDFGMRAIKTVLIRVGQRRQEYNKKRFSAMEETLITIDILKEVNLPKLIAEDVPVFEDIIRDLFTEMEVPKVNPKRLESAISLAIQHLSLQPWENQIEKVIQLYNQLMARAGVMLVGPTGGGKTTIRTILEKALIIFPLVDMESATKLDVFQNNSKRSKVDTFVVNPKCVTIDELFGQTNPSTMEWSDGLLSSAVRGFAKLGIKKAKRKDPSLGETSVDWQWIILDGPVDPLWIENLNSVLDDSRTLCLANSERIYLSSAFRVIFEVDSVSQANPATISRCAMVYVDPADLGWEPYVKTWLQGISEIIPENSIEYLESLFHSSIKIGLTFLNKHKKMQAFPVHQLGIVMNICRIIDSFIHVMKLSQVSQDSKGGEIWFWEKEPNKMLILLEKIFIFAFTWAVGGILKREEEHEGETLIDINTSQDELAHVTSEFNYLVRELFDKKPPTNIQMPPGDKTVFDYFVDLQTGEFEPWGHLVPSTQFLIQKVSALSSVREDSEVEEPSSGPFICKLQLGARTTAAQTKSLITQKLILKSKDVIGAPQSQQALLFIDDLNMPVAEIYGSKPPLEFIRQFVELGGFYDTKHLEWKHVQDIATVACCTPLNVGSNEISTRLLSHFCILVLPATSLQSLQRIFQVLEGLLQAHKSVIVSKETTALLFMHESTRIFHDRLVDLAEKETFYQFLSNELNNYFKIGWNGNGKATCASLASYISECSIYRLSTSYNYTFAHFQEDIKKVYKQAGAEGKRTILLITDSDIIQESFVEVLSCILKSGQVPHLFEKDELNNIIESLTSISEMAKESNKLDDMYSFFLQRVRHNLHIVLTINPTGLVFRQYLQIYPAIVNCCTVDWYENWPEEALCHVAKSYFSQSETFRNENVKVTLIPMTVNIHKNVSIIIEKYLKETKRHYYITPKSYLQFINTFSTMLRTTKEKMLSERACYHSGLTKILDGTSQIADMQDELLVLGPQIESKSKEIEELVAKLHKDALVVEQVRTLVKKDEEIMAAETKIVEGYAKQVTEELNTVLPSLEKALSALDALDKNHIAEVRVYTHPPPLVLTVMNAVCILLQKKPDWATAKLLLSDPGFLKKLITIDKDNLPEKVFLQLKKYVRSSDFNPVKVGLVSVACCSICQWILALDHYHIVKKFVDPKQAKVVEAEELLNRAHSKLDEKRRCLALIEQHQQNLEALYDESIAEQEKLAARKIQTTRRLHSASILSIALKGEMERWKESVNNLDQRLQGIVGDVLISAACIVYSGMLSPGYRQQLVNDSLKLCSDNNILVSPNYSLVNCMTEKNEVRRWQNAGLPHDQYSTENAIIIKHGQRWPLLIDPESQAYKWICQMEGTKLKQINATDANYLKTIEYSLQFGESVLLQDFPETLDSNIKSILSKEIYKKGGQEFIRIGDSEIQYNSDFRLYLTTQKPNPHFLPATCNIVTMINFTLTFHGLQNQLLSAVVNKEKPELEKQYCTLMESLSIDLVALHEYEQRSLQLLQKTTGHLLDDQALIENLQRTKITSSEIFQRVADSAATEVTIEGLRKAYIPIATRGAVLYFVISELVHINHVYQFSLNWFHKIFVDSIDNVKKSDISLSDSLSSTKISEYKVQSEETLTKSETEIDHFKIHIDDIIETLTYHVYETVSSAVFNKNKLCFAFLLCTAIMKNNYGENVFTNKLGFISENEWNFFLYSGMIANIKQPSISDCNGSCVFNKMAPFYWINEIMWKECQCMSTQIPAFSLLCSSLSTYPQQWKDFLDSENVYDLINSESQLVRESEDDEESIPVIFPWEKLSPFERLILIKVLRSEMLNHAVQIFVTEKLGTRYFQTGGINLKGMYEESDSTTPLILIHTHGIDITAVVLRFAQEIKSTQNVQMLSLGRGQASKAEELIYKAQILGEQWVFLQNCHLATSFMPRLCKIVDSFVLPDTTINPGFRLWLSSTPDTSLPIPILRRGLKIVIETPQGLKGTLLQTFGLSDTSVVTETIFNKTNCGPSWKRLLFSLCFFNAVIHERKKYGVLGWNIPYAFNSSDLEFSIKILEVLLEKHQRIPWTALHYLTGEVTYGGHVTDNWDRRCLLSILDNFYNPSVLEEDFVYTADEVYRPISEVDSLKDCRTYLQSLPEVDSPEIFGMHHCAERQYLKAQAESFINSIVSTQPTYSTDIISDRMGQDEIVLEVVSDILIRLPLTVENMEGESTNEYVSTEIVTLRSFMSGPIWAALVKATEDFYSITSSPLLPVLRQEIDRCNNLLYLIIRSLQELQQGIKGKIIFTKRLEELYNSILKGRVADLWEQSSFKTNKPLGSWIDDLIIQVNFFAMWADHIITFMQARFNDLLVLQRQSKMPHHLDEYPDFHASYQGHPSCFWLPGFFFPHGFLIAVCQNYARLNKVTVDSLTFTHKVLPLTQDEDFSFNRKESILNKAFKITLSPSYCGEEDQLLYKCPLYKTPQRTGMLSSMGESINFVTEVNLPSLVTPSHWIMRGVALLCQLDN
ncbi:dynein heavy chain 14, axonemal [Pseudonaja textilis]|uniref:dynein heavy chain 14, axonemal n=1 Tax=Pseudonaja textilis TaxID=8673 RepID=UPI000EAA503E|nr:dynein heavy chain 14, axonemal [Pseudonaja textilis]